MGLFSFIKSAGNKIFKRSKPAPDASSEVEVPSEAQVEISKIDALTAEVNRLGVPVNELSLELSEAITVTGKTDTQADKEKIILALGNVEGIGVVEDKIEVLNPEPEAVFYTVQEGDSLSKISQKQYGDPMKYNDIFTANTPMLKDVDAIYPGQVLRIPTLA